jgi:primosomal protein N'
VVEKAAEAAGRAALAARPEGCRLLGPAPCEVERLPGEFRRHMLLFSPGSRILAGWLDAAGLAPGMSGKARLVLDMDPVSML